MPIITIGIDLAKNVFTVHGVNEGKEALVVVLLLSCLRNKKISPNAHCCGRCRL